MAEHTTLKSVPLRKLVETQKVTGIGNLNFNTNDYPFVTVLQKDKAQNLYFGQKTSEKVSGTFSKGDNIMSFLKDCTVVQTTNKDGEIRFKLSSSEGTSYTSGASLLSAFDVEEVVDFDLNLFDKAFSSKSESVVQAEVTEA